MKRSTLSLVLAALLAAALLTASGPASARDKVHRCTNWSWTGPSNWSAVCSKQGISISSPDGRRGIDWGFSNIFCVAASSYRQSAARFIASQRQSIKGLRFVRKGRLRKVGRNYFRQTIIVTAGRGRRAGKGQLVFDYAAADTTGQYCYQSSKLFMVPRGDYRRGIRQLLRIYRSTGYFGPGLPKGPNGEPA
ncbi:MAG: hypothetical protein KDB54_07500 [Solirubrobacterales bacterium]|nr:hypothetical protein [Solirubrobacterales bacterium]